VHELERIDICADGGGPSNLPRARADGGAGVKQGIQRAGLIQRHRRNSDRQRRRAGRRRVANHGVHRDPDPQREAGANGNQAFHVERTKGRLRLPVSGVRDVPRREVLNRLLTSKAIVLEWVDQAFADERISGAFNGSIDGVLQRLLAQADFVAAYDREGGTSRITRLTIVGKTSSTSKASSTSKSVELQETTLPAPEPKAGSIKITPPTPADLATPLYIPVPAGTVPPPLVAPLAADRSLPLLVPQTPGERGVPLLAPRR